MPGVEVPVGDYLLAVNGRPLYATDNLYSFFDGAAGQQTVITVGTKPDGSDTRNVTVVPIPDEAGLRKLAWINHNIELVDKLSGGKVAYVYMPNTTGAGYDNFNRYFYAQIGKQGLVLDERYNGGGQLANYVVDVLSRKMLAGLIERDGAVTYDPEGAIFGPKALIINQSAGSGGDAMPWYFHNQQLGTLVGTRTWGGLVGVGGFPVLIDGGRATAPRHAIFGLHGSWEVEGRGIPPERRGGDVAQGCCRRPRHAARARCCRRDAAAQRAPCRLPESSALSQLPSARRPGHKLGMAWSFTAARHDLFCGARRLAVSFEWWPIMKSGVGSPRWVQNLRRSTHRAEAPVPGVSPAIRK